jgi:hypothetical protein
LTNRNAWIGFLAGSLFSAAMHTGLCATASAQSNIGAPQSMPSGQIITPLAPTGAVFSRLNPGLKDFPSYTVGQAVKTVISPDGNTLLILTSGYNRLNNAQGVRVAADSNEYVFVFDLTHGALRQTQVLEAGQSPRAAISSTSPAESTTMSTSSPEATTSGPRVAAPWRLVTSKVSASTSGQRSQT